MQKTCKYLRNYALAGVHYFKGLASKDRVLRKLGNQVETHDRKIEHWFSEFAKGSPSDPILLPTPKPGGESKAAFFCPKLMDGLLGIGLVFCVEHGSEVETIAFRLEPPDDAARAHAYSHWQITRDSKYPSLATTLSANPYKWIPDSYPAFPAHCREPIETFFAMLAAVHGYSAKYKQKYALGILASLQSIASELPQLSKGLSDYLLGAQGA